jgi:hypothetical protein
MRAPEIFLCGVKTTAFQGQQEKSGQSLNAAIPDSQDFQAVLHTEQAQTPVDGFLETPA